MEAEECYGRPGGELGEREREVGAEVTALTHLDGGTVVYRVTGELLFASSNGLVGRSGYATDPDTVVIDRSAAHIGDASSVAALETKYIRRGKYVEIIGLNEPSARIHRRLSGELADH